MMTPTIVAGSYDGTLEPVLQGHAVEGLVEESTYLWGLFRTRSARPDVFQVMRRMAHGAAWPARLLLNSNVGTNGMVRHRIDRTAARSTDIIRRSIPSGVELSAPGAESEPLRFAIEDARAHWSEGGILQIEGEEVRPGLQWCLLPSPGGNGMRYTSRIFLVQGQIDDVEVDGFIGMDAVHLQPGHHNYVDDPITAGHLSSAWCTWATAYDDGTVEAGHAAFGPNGFGFALRADADTAYVGETVSGTSTANAEGFPTHITFDIHDGSAVDKWEFHADPTALPLEPLPGPVRQAEGVFRRVGETRQPVVWCATPEVPATQRKP